MTTKKQRREAVERKNSEKKASDKEFSLSQLKVAQYNRLDAEAKKKVDSARHAEAIMMEDIRRAWAQGHTVQPRFGWDKKRINRLEKRVAREGYTARINYSKYSIAKKQMADVGLITIFEDELREWINPNFSKSVMTPLQRQVRTFDDAVSEMSSDELQSYCDNNL